MFLSEFCGTGRVCGACGKGGVVMGLTRVSASCTLSLLVALTLRQLYWACVSYWVCGHTVKNTRATTCFKLSLQTRLTTCLTHQQ